MRIVKKSQCCTRRLREANAPRVARLSQRVRQTHEDSFNPLRIVMPSRAAHIGIELTCTEDGGAREHRAEAKRPDLCRGEQYARKVRLMCEDDDDVS